MKLLLALSLIACGSGRSQPVLPSPVVAGEVVADIVGINEPFPLPPEFAMQLSEEERNRRIDRTIEMLRALGVRHVRLHTSHYPWLSWHGHQARRGGDWTIADDLLRKLLEAGIDPLLMIGPWPGNGPATFTEQYVPRDLAAYTDWVTQVVERYDGDGVDDGPIPRGIRAWEVDNEPDLHNFRPPRQGAMRVGQDPTTFQTPREYSDVARATVAAVRRADETATVLPAGLWRPFQEPGTTYAGVLCGDRGFLESFATMNAHAYPHRDGLPAIWEAARVASCGGTRPVWLTEVSTSSDGAARTEQDQASDLGNLLLEGLRRGIGRIYWHSLMEAPIIYRPRRGPGGLHGHHLVLGSREDVDRSGRHPTWRRTHWKLAAWTLSAWLARFGDVPRSSVAERPATGGSVLSIGSSLAVYSLDGTPVRVELEGRWEATRLVPSEDSGEAIRDGGEPTWERKTVGPGAVTLETSGGPWSLTPQ